MNDLLVDIGFLCYTDTMKIKLKTSDPLEQEVTRLYHALKHLGWEREDCIFYAPLTLKIRQKAKEMNACILAHSYQTPDILFGIADYRGDSLGLSIAARDTSADVIVFCGVRFMAETAKILSPEKKVIHPSPEAGCSLSESITAEKVRELRKKYPDAAFVCYVNTTADVKAECDVCCTSANALKIVEALPEKRVVFLPDRLMGQNIQQITNKEIIIYDGTCIVHESFTEVAARTWKASYPDAKLLVHMEARPEVVALADLAGGTGDMVRYVKENPEQKRFMMVTECGLSDRLRVEFPDREFIGTCSLCPYMKRVNLKNILEAMENPKPDQIVEIPENTRKRALRSLKKMFELTEKKGLSTKPLSHSGEMERS